MKKKLLIISISIGMLLNCCGPIFADDSDTEALKQEITLLKERINSLEVRLRKNEATRAAATAPPERSITSETGLSSILTTFAKEIQVHGFADTSYVFNTNTPVSPNPRTNTLRVFDNDANGFMLNMLQLNLEKPISKESPVGFRVDLDYGEDATKLHSIGMDNTGEFDLQQAYAQIMLPFSLPYMYTLSFKVGKYATLAGAEVIESINNWNFSRAFLFGYAIPFTHTGIRAYYKPFANVPIDGSIGINNGWDETRDINKAKTVEAQVNFMPTEALSLSLCGIFGPERADSDKDFRDLIDLVVTCQVTNKLTLKGNFDYGWERNGGDAIGLNDKNASWYGFAGYAKYDILDWWSIAGRAEYFRDAEGVRTSGNLNSAGLPTLNNLNLYEFTLTNEFRIYKDMIARLEYRYDKADQQAFLKNKLTANNQRTMSAEIAAKF
jgi:hypothetical protein